MAPLDGRVAIVTGANHGIGAATAIELARLGADVVVTYFRFEADDDDPGRPPEYRAQRLQDADTTTTAIGATGRRFVALEADLADPATPARLFDAAEQTLGPADIVVNTPSAAAAPTTSGAATHTSRRRPSTPSSSSMREGPRS